MNRGFLINRGQWSPDIHYRIQASGFTVSFLSHGISFASSRELEEEERHEDESSQEEVFFELTGEHEHEPVETCVWNLEFSGANARPEIEHAGRVAARTHFLLGARENWRTYVPEYREVVYRNVWDGIDVRFKTGPDGGLKYEFLLAPGADPEQIRVAFHGVDDLEVDAAGALRIGHPWHPVTESVPTAYLQEDGAAVPVTYRLIGKHTYAFDVGGAPPRDHAWVIDPLVRVWASFPNPSSSQNIYTRGLGYDQAGNLYITSACDATFPTTPGVYQTTYMGGSDVFVARFDPRGTTLSYMTYIGGTNVDLSWDMDVSPSGEAIVCGTTLSGDFPTTPGAIADSNHQLLRPFVARLNAAGSALVFST